VSPSTIEDYQDTAGAMLGFAAGANHAQPGDPAKLAKAPMVLADLPEPPPGMPFGSEAVRRIETKNAFVAAELARWRDRSVPTDGTPELAQARD
jgi:hypothetical protein